MVHKLKEILLVFLVLILGVLMIILLVKGGQDFVSSDEVLENIDSNSIQIRYSSLDKKVRINNVEIKHESNTSSITTFHCMVYKVSS